MVKHYKLTKPLLVSDLVTSELRVSMKFLNSQEMKDNSIGNEIIPIPCCITDLANIIKCLG